MDAGEDRKAWNQAVKLLGRRALTRGELLRRLERKGSSRESARAAADRAAALGWVDDAKIAARMVERYALERDYGPWRVERELRRRLLEDERIRRAMDGLFQEHPDYEREALRRSRRRWEERYGAPETDADTARLVGHLKRRGFRDGPIRSELLDS